MVEILGIKIIEKEIVLKSELRQGSYFSIIQHGQNIILYRNNFVLHKGKFLYTDCFISKDGINFSPPIRIHDGNCLSHNFSVFRGQDGKIYGIGGMDSWKNNIKWHETDTFEKFKTLFYKKNNREYDRDEERYKKAYNRLINEKFVLDYSDGLYLFSSEDGINFNLEYDDPIITVDHSGFHSALDWKSTEFDGHLCVMHNGNEYILYMRDNVKKGTRFIQYSTSKDLRCWSPIKNIIVNPKFDPDYENYYFPCFMRIGDRFIGILPFFTDTKSCLKVFESFNGYSWTAKHEFFIDKPILIEGKPKNPIHPIQGFINRKGNIYVYIHKNYKGHDVNQDVVIQRCELIL
jgi:hypothetical protein